MNMIEIGILQSIQDIFQCAFLDTIMPPLTSLGNKGMIWIALAVFLLLYKKDKKARTGGWRCPSFRPLNV